MAVRKRTWSKPNGEIGEAWVADYKANGKRHIKTFPTRKEAVAFSNKTGVEISEGRHVADSVSITVADAAAIWIKAVELGRGDNPPAEHSTLRQYRSHLKHHILPAIGKVRLNQLTRSNVSDFRDHLLTKLSRPMAKKVLASFKGILSEAEGRGCVVGNVANSVRIGNKGRHKEPVAIPTKAEVKAIMAKLNEWATDKHWRRLRALFATAIYSGFRASELRGLPWNAVDLKAGTITVKQRADERGVIGSPKTTQAAAQSASPRFWSRCFGNGRSKRHRGRSCSVTRAATCKRYPTFMSGRGVRYSEPSGSPRPMVRRDSTSIACGTSGHPC